MSTRLVLRLREQAGWGRLPVETREALDLAADEIERLRDLLSEVASCGVSQVAEPPGLDWWEIQVDMPTWDALREFRS